MTVVLDWYLGDCGSVTSPAIDSLTPLISHSHLVSHLWNEPLMSLLPCPEPIHCPAATIGTSLFPWITTVYLMTRRWGLSLTELQTKNSVHVPTLMYRDDSIFLFVFVSSSTSSPILPFLRQMLEACWRWSWEAAGFPAWNEDRNLSLALGRDAALGSHTAHELILQLLQQLPAVGKKHTWAGHCRGARGGKMHRQCSCFSMSTGAFVLLFKRTA